MKLTIIPLISGIKKMKGWTTCLGEIKRQLGMKSWLAYYSSLINKRRVCKIYKTYSNIELIMYGRREVAENVRQCFSYSTTLTTKQDTRHKVVLQFKSLLKQTYHTHNNTRVEHDNFCNRVN